MGGREEGWIDIRRNEGKNGKERKSEPKNE